MTRREKILAVVAAFLLVFAPILNLMADTVVSAGGGASTGTVTFSGDTLTPADGSLFLGSSALSADTSGNLNFTRGKWLYLDSSGGAGIQAGLGPLIFADEGVDGSNAYDFQTQIARTSGDLVHFDNQTTKKFSVDFNGIPTFVGLSTAGYMKNTAAGIVSSGTVEHDFSAYRSVRATPAATLAVARTLVGNASTLTADSTITVDVVGSGGGNFVARLCSDGTTCGAGNIYLTCTQTCAAAAGTVTACTVTKSAVSASTTLTWEVGTACATTDPGVNLVAHMTTP